MVKEKSALKLYIHKGHLYICFHKRSLMLKKAAFIWSGLQ